MSSSKKYSINNDEESQVSLKQMRSAASSSSSSPLHNNGNHNRSGSGSASPSQQQQQGGGRSTSSSSPVGSGLQDPLIAAVAAAAAPSSSNKKRYVKPSRLYAALEREYTDYYKTMDQQREQQQQNGNDGDDNDDDGGGGASEKLAHTLVTVSPSSTGGGSSQFPRVASHGGMVLSGPLSASATSSRVVSANVSMRQKKGTPATAAASATTSKRFTAAAAAGPGSPGARPLAPGFGELHDDDEDPTALSHEYTLSLLPLDYGDDDDGGSRRKKKSGSNNNDNKGASSSGGGGTGTAATATTAKKKSTGGRKKYSRWIDMEKHPELKEAAHIISADKRARAFRTKLRFILAFLSIFNLVQVCVFFLIAAPDDQHHSGGNGTLDGRQLPTELSLSKSSRETLLLCDGILQLIITLVALPCFYLQIASRHSPSNGMGAWLEKIFCFELPRSVRTRQGGVSVEKSEMVEIFFWSCACFPGMAHVSENFRYLNLSCIFRLFTIVRAAMEVTEFADSLVTRTLLYFFNLKLDSRVFLRWALDHHRFLTLFLVVPSTFLFFSFCFVLAEQHAQNITFGDSLWFAAVTFSTTGYGDLVPVTGVGRLLAAVEMLLGLILVGYLVQSIRELVHRPRHEALVLDALELVRLRQEVKQLAASVILNRWRLRQLETQEPDDDDEASWLAAEAAGLTAKCKSASETLRQRARELEMKPPVFDPRDEMMRERMGTLEAKLDRQAAMIQELMQLVVKQQQSAAAGATTTTK